MIRRQSTRTAISEQMCQCHLRIEMRAFCITWREMSQPGVIELLPCGNDEATKMVTNYEVSGVI